MRVINQCIAKMTVDEKIQILCGINDVFTKDFPTYGIKSKSMADGPHGLRLSPEKNCTQFPNLCALAATWNTKAAEKMGEAYGDDCLMHNIDMVFGPGCNIKRTPLCGRNFEYFSEDPIVSGELAAGYINGIQKKGIAACLKHFAANNQEKYRCVISADIDERTLREIYLKPFEIAVKKANPEAIMCAYNKINSVWCSENSFLLTEVLRNEWNYDGFVISDFNAVHDPTKALKAGLDYHLPPKDIIYSQIKEDIEKGEITIEELDKAVKNILKFSMKPKKQSVNYNRDKQHQIAREIAAEGIVLLKNEQSILPLTEEKYKKIALIGEFAKSPMITGQGSSEVYIDESYIDSPLSELKKLLPNTQIGYREIFKKGSYNDTMLWPQIYSPEFIEYTKQTDIVIVFAGSMQSEDTEMFDRRTIELNPNYERYIQAAAANNKKVVLVLQTASAVDLSRVKNSVSAIVQMWFGGEAAGGAIADVLCGIVNPSGKLPETFPNKLRADIDYPGNGYYVSYNEKLDVGYRYYDRHPDEICYPFGHGLSYTKFEYSNITTRKTENGYTVSFKLKNSGEFDGAEVVQLYISDIVSTMPKPIKELKQFKKIFLSAGEEQEVIFNLSHDDFSYYNTVLHQWVAENGWYKILIGASSQDIRLTEDINYTEKMPYTTLQVGDAGVSDSSVCFG